MSMAVEDAAVQRRRLRAELRRARVRAHQTQRDVADAMDWSLSKLIRIESGSVGISTTDLKVLLQHYDLEESEIDRLVQLARASKDQQAWWTEYKDVISPKYLEYLKLEGSASVIQDFEPMFVPGLLQDEDYARAIFQEFAGSASKKRIDTWVELRMRRQDEMSSLPNPPHMEFVLDEAALRRLVGGSEVMGRQLRRLREEAAKEYVTIEVIPFSAGAHPGMKGPFVILEFDSEMDDDLLFLEVSGQDMSRQGKQKIKPYRDAWGRLRNLARRKGLEEVIDDVFYDLSVGRESRLERPMERPSRNSTEET